MILLGNIHLPFQYRCLLLRCRAQKLMRLPSDHRTCSRFLFSREAVVFPSLIESTQPACAHPGFGGLDLSEYQQSA